MRRGGKGAIREVGRFFMQQDPVHDTLRGIAARLADLRIPYAIVGGMALVAHGYARTTVDVDVLIMPEGLDAAHKSLAGLGYVPVFAGSKNLRDTQTGVCIKFLVTGQYPGDGQPKPVAFPDPAQVSVEIDGMRFVGLPTLIELKLASGMTNPGRLRDLADVQELIRVLDLPPEYAEQLNPYVREKFRELRRGIADPSVDGRDEG
jgi:hypothetical protein